MGTACPGRHLTSLRPWYHADLLRNHGLHCRGVTRERLLFYRAPNHYGGAENLNRITSAFFNTVYLLPKDLRFEHGGAKLASCPGRHLTSLRLCCTGTAAYLKLVFGFASFLNRASIISFPLHSYFTAYCFSFQSCRQALQMNL